MNKPENLFYIFFGLFIFTAVNLWSESHISYLEGSVKGTDSQLQDFIHGQKN